MLKFTVYELDEALVVRAALDAAIEEMKRQKDAQWVKPCSCDPYETSTSTKDAAVLDTLSNITAQPLADDLTTATIQTVVPFTKEELKEAAKFNEELAALVSRKGKKSAEQMARMYMLAEQVRLDFEAGLIEEPEAAVEEPVVQEPIGKVFASASAADLQALLEATTAPVSVSEGVEVRSLLPNFLDDTFNLSAAETGTAVEQPAAEVTNSWDQFTDAQLLSQIEEHMQNGGGIHWFKNVVALGGGDWNKMPRDHMIKVLTDPDSFNPVG